jgi:hypothetical protein
MRIIQTAVILIVSLLCPLVAHAQQAAQSPEQQALTDTLGQAGLREAHWRARAMRAEAQLAEKARADAGAAAKEAAPTAAPK